MIGKPIQLLMALSLFSVLVACSTAPNAFDCNRVYPITCQPIEVINERYAHQ